MLPVATFGPSRTTSGNSSPGLAGKCIDIDDLVSCTNASFSSGFKDVIGFRQAKLQTAWTSLWLARFFVNLSFGGDRSRNNVSATIETTKQSIYSTTSTTTTLSTATSAHRYPSSANRNPPSYPSPRASCHPSGPGGNHPDEAPRSPEAEAGGMDHNTTSSGGSPRR